MTSNFSFTLSENAKKMKKNAKFPIFAHSNKNTDAR